MGAVGLYAANCAQWHKIRRIAEIGVIKMQHDKNLHFLCGFIISLLIGLDSPVYGLCAGVIAGVAKEVYDYFDYGRPDIKDFLATALGSILGTCLGTCLYMTTKL